VEDLIMKIAPGIYRIGGNSMINAYLIEQAGEVTIIDAGVCSVPPRGRGSSWSARSGSALQGAGEDERA
jgi:hypothetical protein